MLARPGVSSAQSAPHCPRLLKGGGAVGENLRGVHLSIHFMTQTQCRFQETAINPCNKVLLNQQGRADDRKPRPRPVRTISARSQCITAGVSKAPGGGHQGDHHHLSASRSPQPALTAPRGARCVRSSDAGVMAPRRARLGAAPRAPDSAHPRSCSIRTLTLAVPVQARNPGLASAGSFSSLQPAPQHGPASARHSTGRQARATARAGKHVPQHGRQARQSTAGKHKAQHGRQARATARAGKHTPQHGPASARHSTGRQAYATARAGKHTAQHGRQARATARAGKRAQQHGPASARHSTGRQAYATARAGKHTPQHGPASARARSGKHATARAGKHAPQHGPASMRHSTGRQAYATARAGKRQSTVRQARHSTGRQACATARAGKRAPQHGPASIRQSTGRQAYARARAGKHATARAGKHSPQHGPASAPQHGPGHSH
ncbi:hypothetical protein NDU88_008697 [Pleurodeles waltl]|uniref:Uncharacterized protein n=1 Tax=Pleurodeles waltl TaxID=8319 RepID=A0AAV7N5R3_PLEWA|nr:hypothetical protein NDU88_008697 [Pleurodeles waltl]